MKLLMELAKSLYIFMYEITYYFCSFFANSIKYDTVIIAKHRNNAKNYLALYPKEKYALISDNKSLINRLGDDPNCKKIIKQSLFTTVQQIWIILHSQKVVLDDYYAPLHVIDQSKDVWNIWHAYAIYKKIALLAPLYSTRNPLSISRFYKNYQRINRMYVRSSIERDIFMQSYRLTSEQIRIKPELYLSTLPAEVHNPIRQKVILYAPTHRPYKYNYDAVFSWIEQKYPDYEVIASYHQLTVKHDFDNIAASYQKKYTVDNVLKVAEYFFTDYSSLLIEVSNLCPNIKTRQIVDPVDWQTYNEIQGLNSIYYDTQVKQVRMDKTENRRDIMQKRKIMFFDIDGTLLPFSHKEVSAKMKSGLQQLRDNGVKVGIATGRRNSSYARIFGDFEVDFLITSNGRHVEIAEQDYYVQPIGIDVLERLIAYDKKYQVGLNYSSSSETASYYGTNEKGVAYLARLHEIQPIIDKEFHKEKDILQAMIYADEATEAIFKEDFPELTFVRHKQDGIDVLAAGPMKERGIQVVLDYFNLDREDALAFGDGLNDVGMFEYIDGVALGFSHPELLALAVDQIGNVEDDGIYDFLLEHKYIID